MQTPADFTKFLHSTEQQCLGSRDTKQGAMGDAGAGGGAAGDGNALLLGPCSCSGKEGAIQCTACKQVRVTRLGQCFSLLVSSASQMHAV